MAAQIIRAVVDQYAVDAPFLWLLRDQASRSPVQTGADLCKVDARLCRHIDGLRIAGAAGRERAAAELTRYPEGGEAFVAAVLALDAGDRRSFLDLAAVHAAHGDTRRGLLSAMGWVGSAQLKDTVQDLLSAEDPDLRALGVGAYSVYRADPGARVEAFLRDAPQVRARALRLVGETGRRDLMGALVEACDEADRACGFWAAWSAVRLGDRGAALDRLRAEADASDIGWRAFVTVLAAMAPDAARDWLRGRWAGDLRFLVVGAGLTGMPDYLPWLVEGMETPEHARLAGEAVALITGIELDALDLTVDPVPVPEGEELDLDEEPAEPAPEPGSADAWFALWERDLPEPAPDKVKRFLIENPLPLSNRTRHLMGRPVSSEWLREIDRRATQRVRRFAALLSGLAEPQARLINCSLRRAR